MVTFWKERINEVMQGIAKRTPAENLIFTGTSGIRPEAVKIGLE